MANVTDIPQHVFSHNATDGHNLTVQYPNHPTSTSSGMWMNLLTPAVNNPYLQDSLRFLFFGSILETGRRLWQWLIDRFTGGFVLKAIFDEGDPAFEWLSDFLKSEKVWNKSREYKVTARSTMRRWGVTSGSQEVEGHAEYVPAYEAPQLFWWKGTCIQVSRLKSALPQHGHDYDGGCISMTLYTRKREVLNDLVEETRKRYMCKERPRITVHSTDSCGCWCITSTKARRPIDSLILPTGVKEMLLDDTQDFLRSEAWYADAGIQHKRGYLLYGAPGTGKSSTIHALAGELDLEIYSLSLSANGLDDATLGKLMASTPTHSIILIEDIDCAFPSREQQAEEEKSLKEGVLFASKKSNVTLSGLLNMIDGVSSEEGRLLFATTNHVDRLDSALLRPGRMDLKLHYTYATRSQITLLFKRFYISKADRISNNVESGAVATTVQSEKATAMDASGELTPPPSPQTENQATELEKTPSKADRPDLAADKSTSGLQASSIFPPRLPVDVVNELAEQFANVVPEDTFTVGELQNYLLSVKTRPFQAVNGVQQWMKDMEEEKERIRRKAEEKPPAKGDGGKDKKGEDAPTQPSTPGTTTTDSKPALTVSTGTDSESADGSEYIDLTKSGAQTPGDVVKEGQAPPVQ